MEKLKDEKLNNEQIVKIGSKVDVLFIYAQDDIEEKTVIIKNNDGNGNDIISANTPLARCLLGMRQEDERSYKVNDILIKVKALKIY